MPTRHNRSPLELRHVPQQGKEHPPDLRGGLPSISSFTADHVDKTAQLFHAFPLHRHTPFQPNRDTATGKRANTSGLNRQLEQATAWPPSVPRKNERPELTHPLTGSLCSPVTTCDHLGSLQLPGGYSPAQCSSNKNSAPLSGLIRSAAFHCLCEAPKTSR